MNLRLYIFCIAAVLALVLPAAADNSTAKVYGGVYSADTFESLDNAIVDVNSTPSQSMVAKSGIYSFDLDPGNYSITAKYYQNSTLTYSATETITITKGGSYRLDLLLLPVYSEELMEGSTVNLSSENSTFSTGSLGKTTPVNKTNASNSINVPEQTRIYSSNVSYLLIALALFLLLAVGYSLFKRQKKINENKPLKGKIDHITGDSTRSGNSPEFKTETCKTIDLEQEQSINTSIEEMEPATGLVKPESKIPVIEPETEAESNTQFINPVVESELKIYSMEQAVELESGESEKGKTADYKEERKEERKEEYKEKYPVQVAEIAESESDEEKNDSSENPATKNNSSEKPARNSNIEISAPNKKLPLPADLQEIIDIIRGHGGRITQKDLRSRLKYSEGKVSLMLADLERRDLIEKFKRGRGNVVILKDEER